MRFHPALVELADTFLSSFFDPGPISFRPEHEVGIKVVTDAAATLNQRVTLSRMLTRNAFLNGCHAITDGMPIEHLLVGFGEWHGSTTRITSLYHCTGRAGSVKFPRDLTATMTEHMQGHKDHELVVYHNHPRSFWNTWVHRDPLASVTDRNTLWKGILTPTQIIKTLLGGGDLLFFVGENGRVRQIKVPAILRAIEEISRRFPPAAPPRPPPPAAEGIADILP